MEVSFNQPSTIRKLAAIGQTQVRRGWCGPSISNAPKILNIVILHSFTTLECKLMAVSLVTCFPCNRNFPAATITTV